MNDLKNPIYNNDNYARKHLESLRWPDGPVCHHCGGINNSKEMKGTTTRLGLYKCNYCRKPYTVTVGTILQRSHVPMSKWCAAVRLIVAGDSKINTSYLHKYILVSYKTGWRMQKVIYQAMLGLAQ